MQAELYCRVHISKHHLVSCG